jgi:hypothetical protein
MNPSGGNPYRPGGALSPNDLFVDREDELSKITAALKEERSVAVYGQRRIGKTSLLNRLEQLAPRIGKNVKFIFFSMEPIIDETDFLKTFASYVKKVRKWETYTDFDLALRDGDTRYILMLDEFDKTAGNPAFSANFFGALRSWCSQPWMDMVISSLFPLSDYSVQGYMTSPFYNIFQLIVPLDVIGEEAAMHLLRPLSKLSPKWKMGWQEEVIRKTECYPYRLQLFGFHAYELLTQKPAATLSEAMELYSRKLHISEPYEKARIRKFGDRIFAANMASREFPAQKRKRRGRFHLPAAVIGILFALGSFTALGGLIAQSVALALIGLAFILLTGLLIILR